MDTDTMLEDDRVEKLRWEALVACDMLWDEMNIDNGTKQMYIQLLRTVMGLEGEV